MRTSKNSSKQNLSDFDQSEISSKSLWRSKIGYLRFCRGPLLYWIKKCTKEISDFRTSLAVLLFILLYSGTLFCILKMSKILQKRFVQKTGFFCKTCHSRILVITHCPFTVAVPNMSHPNVAPFFFISVKYIETVRTQNCISDAVTHNLTFNGLNYLIWLPIRFHT